MRPVLVVNKPPIALPHSSLPRSRPALLRFLLPQEHLVLAEVAEVQVEVGAPVPPVLSVLENVQRFGSRFGLAGLTLLTAGLNPGRVGFVSLPLADFTSPLVH